MTTRVSWNVGCTINIGNFESVRIEGGIESDALEGETAKEASDRVFAFVLDELEQKAVQARKRLTQ